MDRYTENFVGRKTGSPEIGWTVTRRTLWGERQDSRDRLDRYTENFVGRKKAPEIG